MLVTGNPTNNGCPTFEIFLPFFSFISFDILFFARLKTDCSLHGTFVAPSTVHSSRCVYCYHCSSSATMVIDHLQSRRTMACDHNPDWNPAPPPQYVDLFPGGFWQSNILSPYICPSGTQTCSNSLLAGSYDPSKSATETSIVETGSVQNSMFEDKGLLTLECSTDYAFDLMTIKTVNPPYASVAYQNFDMLMITEGYSTLPNGRNYTIPVGNLALGAPNINQSWNHAGELFNSSLVPSSLYLQGEIASNSFGMHIGSTAMSIPPSIYIRGYDQNRVLANVRVQDYNIHYFPIDLLDIGIGVAEGSSPFTFNSKNGLLTYGNSSIRVSLQVIVERVSPFLYLSKSTYDAIATYLPVTYNTNLGLYFWDTTASAYRTIVTSPSYLSFTFRLNSSITETITINFPFSLLNLTLTPPLVASPTQYFPCTPYDYGKYTVSPPSAEPSSRPLL